MKFCCACSQHFLLTFLQLVVIQVQQVRMLSGQDWVQPMDFNLSDSLPGSVKAVINHTFFKPFVCWIVWLVFGSIYYAHALDFGWSKGFYMAVNVGYSIGWGYPNENSDQSRVFSTFYVLTGSSAVAASLGYFANAMIASSKDWYAKALEQEKFRHATYYEKWIVYLKMHDASLKIIGVWLLWILAMIIFSLATVKWNFSEALYFAVSSLSTGGLWAIPSDSPEWYFGVVGFFAATGIPLMALAMANIASMVITIGDPDEAEKTIAAKVTLKELQMMQKFDLDDGDGQISRAEYILLCTVRLGALSPELIGKINERFKLLDTSGDGMLSYAEILEHPEGTVVNVLHPDAELLELESGKSARNGNGGGSTHSPPSTGSGKDYTALLSTPRTLVKRLSGLALGSWGNESLLDAEDNV